MQSNEERPTPFPSSSSLQFSLVSSPLLYSLYPLLSSPLFSSPLSSPLFSSLLSSLAGFCFHTQPRVNNHNLPKKKILDLNYAVPNPTGECVCVWRWVGH